MNCAICGRPSETRVCEPDRTRMLAHLAQIPVMHAQLGPALVPGQAQGQRVTGSREAPLPLRVDALDLGMPARAGQIHDDLGDQTGMPSVASVLDSWVRDWRDTRARGEAAPLPTVVTLARWLTDRLDWACDHHGAIDEFAGELHRLTRALRGTLGLYEVRPALLDAPCSRCDARALHRLPGEDRVECGACGRLLTEDEYGRWCGLLVANGKEAA
ncbi:MAG: hypothetical protein V4510_12075 [bacterium]